MSECFCCGKKIGILSSLKSLDGNPEKGLCPNCYNLATEDFDIFKNDIYLDKTMIRILINRVVSVKQKIEEAKLTDDGKTYMLDYVEQTKQETLTKMQEEFGPEVVKQTLDELNLDEDNSYASKLCRHMLTTGMNFEGYKIKQYKGLVSGSLVLGTGFLSEFTSDISDFFGSESSLFGEKIETAKTNVLNKLIKASVDRGGNGLIAITFDYMMFKNNMIGVSANGTSVLLESIEKTETKNESEENAEEKTGTN